MSNSALEYKLFDADELGVDDENSDKAVALETEATEEAEEETPAEEVAV